MKVHEQITPQTWCKENFAKDKKGHQTIPRSNSAVAWCMNGWLNKVYGEISMMKQLELEDKIKEHLPKNEKGEPLFKSITSFNDDEKTTYEMVVDVFKKADL